MKWILAILAGLMLIAPASAKPASLPAGFTETVYASGLNSPTGMEFAPDGRLFVTEKTGALRVIDAQGVLLPDPFLTVTVDTEVDKGLVGFTFDPDFVHNHYIYIHYVSPGVGEHDPSFGVLARYTADGDKAAPGSATVLVTFDPVITTSHAAGAIHFGPDGKLYVAEGDDFFGPNAQTFGNRHGKILRYNADGSIPEDNPYYNVASGANRAIWAYGLRNPYTFNFHPVSGLLYINDVGWDSWEEVDAGAAGANYGWPDTEGYFDGHPEFTAPVYAYPHLPDNCNVIVGAEFYAPPVPLLPARYVDDYFFNDGCHTDLWTRDSETGAVSRFFEPSYGEFYLDMDTGPDGALYYLSYAGGLVSRIGYAPPARGQLVANGSFEDGALHPSDWTAGASAQVKRVCSAGKASKGQCALRVKSGKVQQTLDGRGLLPGGTLDFSARVSGEHLPTGAALTLKVKTASGAQNYVLTVPGGTYPAAALSRTAIPVGAPVLKLVVSITVPAGGKLFVDAVSIKAHAP